MISAGVSARLFLKAAPQIQNNTIYPSAYGKFRTWSQRGVSTDGGSYDYLRVRAESVPFFVQKWFLRSAKRKRIGCECVAASGAQKTRLLKKFDIRKVGKAQIGAKVAPTRAIVAKML